MNAMVLNVSDRTRWKHMPEIPVPDFDDLREVYAFFGLAMHNANLVEGSLINLAVVLHLDRVAAITQGVLEATFKEMEAKTLGQLLRATRTLTDIALDLETVLNEALARRNYLAHHFFREHADNLIHNSGKKVIIEELQSMIKLFIQADKLVAPVYMRLMRKYGVSESSLQAELDRAYEAVKSVKSRL